MNDTIIDLCLNVSINNVISKNAIQDHIFDIVFDLYEELIYNEEMNQQLIDICMKTFEIKINEYIDFINEGLTEDITKNELTLDSFMAEKVDSLTPMIKNYLIEHYDLFSKRL